MEFHWTLFWYLLESFALLRGFIFLVTRAVMHKMMDTSSKDGTSVDKACSADNNITQFSIQSSLNKDADNSLVHQDASPSWFSEAKKRSLAVSDGIKSYGKEAKERVSKSIKSFGKGFLNAMEKTRSAEHGSSLDEFMSDPAVKEEDCVYSRDPELRSGMSRSSGFSFNAYIGLPNEGNTCFLNSLLQCLYQTPEFRDKLSKCENNCGETLLAVEIIFNALEEKEIQNVTTRKLTACLGLKPFKQQDVPEVFLLLLNTLDDELSNGSYFKELYASTMVSLTECAQCKTKDGLDMGCNIVILPLPVSSVRSGEECWSVTDALEHFLRSSEMKGDNQMYCSNCRGKTDATLRQALTSLPPILVVQLKRFEFSFYEQRFVKLENEMHINTTLEFPCEKTSQKDKKSYDLFAICDHYGGFKSGHYSALIKPEKNDKWFCFNDSTVMPVEISDPESRKSFGYNSSRNKYDLKYDLSRSRTAYVLMYRQKMEREPQKSEDAPGPADLMDSESSGNLMLEQSPDQDKPEEQLQPAAEDRRGVEWQEEARRREAAGASVRANELRISQDSTYEEHRRLSQNKNLFSNTSSDIEMESSGIPTQYKIDLLAKSFHKRCIDVQMGKVPSDKNPHTMENNSISPLHFDRKELHTSLPANVTSKISRSRNIEHQEKASSLEMPLHASSQESVQQMSSMKYHSKRCPDVMQIKNKEVHPCKVQNIMCPRRDSERHLNKETAKRSLVNVSVIEINKNNTNEYSNRGPTREISGLSCSSKDSMTHTYYYNI